VRADALLSRNLVLGLKDGRAVGSPPLTVAARIVVHLKAVPSSAVTLSGFLSPSATLVPVPKSTLLTRGALWVPNQFSQELVKGGFGRSVAPLLERTEPIPRAATSISTERPTALRNYETLRVRKSLEAPSELLLVDDVVTAGATLLGSASRLREAYPEVPIKGFAAARTISVAARFHKPVEPVMGTIVLRSDGRTQRDP
jgi:predicted amidophosphoribosyltransferase